MLPIPGGAPIVAEARGNDLPGCGPDCRDVVDVANIAKYAVSENVPVQQAVPESAKRPRLSEKRLRAVHQSRGALRPTPYAKSSNPNASRMVWE